MNREERAKYLGGTDLAHVFNLPRYYCARKLWYDKTLTPEDYPDDSRAGLFALGHALEPECKRRYIERTGARVWQYKDIPHRAEGVPGWLGGHPDGIIDHPARKGQGVLECKTFGGRAWLQMTWADGIPKAYLLQLQTYLWQTGLTWAAWACLNRDTGEFLTFDVDRDEGLIKAIATAAHNWWLMLQGGATPVGWQPKCHDDDAPCPSCPWRHTCLGGKLRSEVEALAENRRLRGDLQPSDDRCLGRLVRRRDAIYGPYMRAKAHLDHINAAIKARLGHIGQPDGVSLDGRKVTAYERQSSRWDEKAMRADGVDVARYKVPGKTSRSLSVGKGE